MPLVKIYGLATENTENKICRYDVLIETETKIQRLSKSYQHISTDRALLRGLIAAVDILPSFSAVKLVTVTSLNLISKEESVDRRLIEQLIEKLDHKGCTWKEVIRYGKTKQMQKHIENSICAI